MEAYSRSLLRISAAQILMGLGWQAIHSTPLEMITDILERYLLQLGRTTHAYAEQFGRSFALVEDIQLAFQDVGVSVDELSEYTAAVEPASFPHRVARVPAAKPTDLRFPAPGARELAERGEHVPEYLPLMQPEAEEESPSPTRPFPDLMPPEEPSTPIPGEKRAMLPGSSEMTPPSKRPRILPDEAGHSTYEMKSVMMSSGGLLTPTRGQGRLPAACTPPPPTPAPVATSSAAPAPHPLTTHSTAPSRAAPSPVPTPGVKVETLEERTTVCEVEGVVSPATCDPEDPGARNDPDYPPPASLAPPVERVGKSAWVGKVKGKPKTKDGSRPPGVPKSPKVAKSPKLLKSPKGLGKSPGLSRSPKGDTSKAAAASSELKTFLAGSKAARPLSGIEDGAAGDKKADIKPSVSAFLKQAAEARQEQKEEEEEREKRRQLEVQQELGRIREKQREWEKQERERLQRELRMEDTINEVARKVNCGDTGADSTPPSPAPPSPGPITTSPPPVAAEAEIVDEDDDDVGGFTPPSPPRPSRVDTPRRIGMYSADDDSDDFTVSIPQIPDSPPMSPTRHPTKASLKMVPQSLLVPSPSVSPSTVPSEPPSPPPKPKSKEEKEHKKDKKKKKSKDREKDRPDGKKDKDRKEKDKRKEKKKDGRKDGDPSIPKLTFKLGGAGSGGNSVSMSVDAEESPPLSTVPKLVISRPPTVAPPPAPTPSFPTKASQKAAPSPPRPSRIYTPSPPSSPSPPPSPDRTIPAIPPPPPSSTKRKPGRPKASPKKAPPPPEPSPPRPPTKAALKAPPPALLKLSPPPAPPPASTPKSPKRGRPAGSLNKKKDEPTAPTKVMSPRAAKAPPSSATQAPASSSTTATPSAAEEAGALRTVISETIGKIVDEHGETVWICPGCKMADDGSPMIGCDQCDDWYHWPCVGITREPSDEDWFCPRCSARRADSGKVGPSRTDSARAGKVGKKKRKKKVT